MIVITAQGSWPCGQYYRGGNSDALTTAPTDSVVTDSDMRLLNADTIVGAGASALDGDIWLKCCCFTSTETVGLLGTGAQDVHLDLHTAPEI